MSKVTKVVDSLHHNASLVKELITKDSVSQAEIMIREARGKVADELFSKNASVAIRSSITPQIKTRKTIDVNIVSKGLNSRKTRLDYFNKEFGGCVKSIEFNKTKNEYIISERYKDGRIMKLQTHKEYADIKLIDDFSGKEDSLYIPKKVTDKNRKVMYIGKKDGNVDLRIVFAKDGITIEKITGAKAEESQHLIGQKLDNKYLEEYFGRPLNITAEEITEYKKAIEEDNNLTIDYLGMVLPKMYQGKQLSPLDQAVYNAFNIREKWYPDINYQKAMDNINDIIKKNNS